jgi:hypothetical protein
MKVFTLSQTRAIQTLASELGIPSLWLVALIDCESGWNPKAMNSIGAAGLNQIIPSTARNLGLPEREALIRAYPAIESQLQGPTRSYLMRLKPFSSLQDLALSNFAPAYRKAPSTPLTGLAAQYNPQFKTYGEYATIVINRAKKLETRWKAQELAAGHPVATGVGVVAFTGLAAWIAWKYL